jgi:hypothetical protein
MKSEADWSWGQSGPPVLAMKLSWQRNCSAEECRPIRIRFGSRCALPQYEVVLPYSTEQARSLGAGAPCRMADPRLSGRTDRNAMGAAARGRG